MSNDPFHFHDNNDFDVPEAFREATQKRRIHLIPFVLIGGLLTSALTLAIIYFVSEKIEGDVLSVLLAFIPVCAIILGGLAGSGYAIACYATQFRASLALIGLIFCIQASVFVGGRYMSYLILVKNVSDQIESTFHNIKILSVEPGAESASTAANDPGATPAGADDQGEKVITMTADERERLASHFISNQMKPSSFWAYYKRNMESTTLKKIGKPDKEEEPEGKEFGKFGYLFELYIMLSFCFASTISLFVLLGVPYCRRCA